MVSKDLIVIREKQIEPRCSNDVFFWILKNWFLWQFFRKAQNLALEATFSVKFLRYFFSQFWVFVKKKKVLVLFLNLVFQGFNDLTNLNSFR